MTNNHRTALVTGANTGIGYETTRQLSALGWTVWLGARDPERGRVAAMSLEGDVRFVQLDVTDDTSVRTALATIGAETGLDVLINNAGIAGTWAPADEIVPSDFLPVFGVNLLGPVRMLHTALPLLRKSSHPVVVNVSSGMGSFGVTTDPQRFESQLASVVYPASKAALNMVTSQVAKALPWLTINSVDPGYTATDLNGFNGFQTVEQGAWATVTAATSDPGGPTGGFFDANGPLPW